MENMEKKAKADLRKELEGIYTPLSVAKEEILRRWNDKELRKKVEDFLEGDVPEFLKDEPKAYLARHIVSPNFDFLRFQELSKLSDLSPICPEFTEDKFSAKNLAKYHLCKMYFFKKTKKINGCNLNTQKIIDFEKYEGKKFKNIQTLWNENIIDFHHRILRLAGVENNGMIADISGWFDRKGKTPDKFYKYFLALFICHGVLFENFLVNAEEQDFTCNLVLPIIKKLEKIFELKPLIVPLLPFEDEEKEFGYYYPKQLEVLYSRYEK